MVQENMMSRTIHRVSLGVLIAVFVGLVFLSPNTPGETRIPITKEYILVRDTPTPEKGTSVYGLRTWEHQYTVTNTPKGPARFVWPRTGVSSTANTRVKSRMSHLMVSGCWC